LGINPAYLFTKEWIVGVYAGLKWKELFNWPGKFDPTFTFDLQNLSQPGNGSEHDSVLIEYFASQTTIKYQLGGIGYGQLGFIIGNSRLRYLPLIKISRSWTAWSVEGYMYDGVYTNDFLYLHTQREYGMAMSWTIMRDEDRRVTIGPYFHWTNFKSLNLEGLWFHEFADPMLAEKYPRVWRTGITLSFEYY
jgi:hypothetical protein